VGDFHPQNDIVTMHGMGAFYQAAPHITFAVDKHELIRCIDEALGDHSLPSKASYY
jgi:hypothetical protein